MQNDITTLRIQNFKSIKDVTMTPRRVNIIIGEPNVGKSNILEAISLLGGMFFDKADGKFMDGQIRYQTLRNLFYDNEWSEQVEVLVNDNRVARLKRVNENVGIEFGKLHDLGAIQTFYQARVSVDGLRFELKMINKEVSNVLPGLEFFDDNNLLAKKYSFAKYVEHGRSYDESYLRPPYGDDLLDIIKAAPSTFKKEIGQFFTPFGLNLALRPEELEVQKNVEGVITAIPYALIADTLQRLIFYLAAIESNDDAVLLFEEPEAHSYPTYVAQLARRIVESRSNQFFIVTHSPYLITEILEEMLPDDELADELAIFVAYYEDYQTKIWQLTDEEVIAVRSDGLDVFYNLARFVPGQME